MTEPTSPDPAATPVNMTNTPVMADEDELSLSVPKALPVVSPEKAQALVRAGSGVEAKKSEITAEASKLMTRIEDIDPNSPEFQKALSTITDIGKTDALITGQVSSSLLSRKDITNSPAGKKVAASLTDLRTTISDLDPSRADLTGVKKPLKMLARFVPGGDHIERYMHKFESNQDKLDAIVASLTSGQQDLVGDNNALSTEQQRLWSAMSRLDEAGETLASLDTAIEARIAELKDAGELDKAEGLKTNALFPVRQRRQDVATELAVATQGYMSIALLLENNDQLIKGVERAKTTTVAALYTAVIIQQALSRQKMVLDQVTALRDTTSNLIESSSKQMREQGAEINKKSSEAMIDVNKLQAAFDNVYATMDAVEGYKSAATDSMRLTIDSLNTQIERAAPRIEHARNQVEARDARVKAIEA